MTSLILNDGYEIQIASSSRYNYIIAYVADYNGLGNLMSKLTRNNLSNVSIKFSEENIETHHNMALMEPHVSVTQRSGDLQIEFGLRELSQEEVTEETLLTAISYLSDEQALTVKSLYLEWDSDPIGYEYKTSNSSDSRRQFNGKLWKLNKDHKKQLDWYPGADPTLWTEIVEGHEGTIEDPIPVPDSVTTSGFEYVYGKYYQDLGTVNSQNQLEYLKGAAKMYDNAMDLVIKETCNASQRDKIEKQKNTLLSYCEIHNLNL